MLCDKLHSPLVGETNWMETGTLPVGSVVGVLHSPLVGETNWMETAALEELALATQSSPPHSLGKLIEWKQPVGKL